MARISYAGEGSSFRKMLNHSPAVSAAYWSLRKALDDGVLPPKIRMLTFLAADLTNHCRYWIKAHTNSGRALGITQDMVDTLLDADRSPLFTDAEKAAITLAKELTAKAELSNEAFDHAARYFDERQLVELVVNVGVANLNNRVTDAFWADIEEQE